MSKPTTTYILEKETVDGIERTWYEVDGNEYAVIRGDVSGSLLDVEGRQIATLDRRGYLDVAGNYPEDLHDVAAAIREFCRDAA